MNRKLRELKPFVKAPLREHSDKIERKVRKLAVPVLRDEVIVFEPDARPQGLPV